MKQKSHFYEYLFYKIITFESIPFIFEFPTIQEVENLHQDKSIENESKMSSGAEFIYCIFGIITVDPIHHIYSAGSDKFSADRVTVFG